MMQTGRLEAFSDGVFAIAESAPERPHRQSRHGLFWSAPPSRRLSGGAAKRAPPLLVGAAESAP
jgi:hypothetical protein